MDKVSDSAARFFYIDHATREAWSLSKLRMQVQAQFYERSRDTTASQQANESGGHALRGQGQNGKQGGKPH